MVSNNIKQVTIDTTAYPPSSETQGIIIRCEEFKRPKRTKSKEIESKRLRFLTKCKTNIKTSKNI